MREQTEPASRRAEYEIYTRRLLAIYDTLVLGLYLRWVWRCPRSVLAEHYRANIGRRHLDVGPGTGYFLSVAYLCAGTAITLLDPNPEVLTYAGRRLAGHTTPRRPCAPTPANPCRSPALSSRWRSTSCCTASPGPTARLRRSARRLGARHPDVHSRFGRTALGALNRRGIFANSTTPRQRSARCCTARSPRHPRTRRSGRHLHGTTATPSPAQLALTARADGGLFSASTYRRTRPA